MTAILVALALYGSPSVKPWPVGPGPRYTPRAASAAVLAGRPIGGLRCAPAGAGFRVHIELFADRRVIVLPSGIGVASPLRRSGATVAPGGCVYPVRTLAPDGVVEVAKGRALTLADVFRVWGEPLTARKLVSFGGAVRAYVRGRRVRGPLGAIRLVRHAQIVLELGAYLAPHPFFVFPGGDS